MGTYLSKPITDKESDDLDNGWLSCGSSTMQGWRESQEDAHNCLLDFDDRVALFAVYDGHGGAEVAQYAAENLPVLVKNTFYSNQDYGNALIRAFMDFDNSLIETPIVEQLMALREDIIEETDDEEVNEAEELDDLYEEARIPIEEIIMKYKNSAIESIHRENENILRKKKYHEQNSSDEPSSSKGSSISKPKFFDVQSNDACGSSSSVTVPDDDKTNVGNGINKHCVPVTSESECGPSGSNGTEKNVETARLILDDSDDDDSDEDEFTGPMRLAYDSESSSDEEDIRSLLFEDDEEDKPGKDSGCTAVMALLVNNKLYVANAGDSRCVVSIDGKAHDMSKDHKPEDDLELNRITKAGGKVTSDGRVNGGLNLSRALGDHNYKKNKDLPNTEQMITALPDITVLDVTPNNNNFIVLACDGIWNSLSSQEVVDFILERINKPDVKLSSICEELFEQCLAPDTSSDGTGCDNMTCIIVKLKPKQKRSHSGDEEDDSEGGESKKHKSDSTEPESVH